MKGRLAIIITLTLLISGFYYYFLTYRPSERPVTYIPKSNSIHLSGNPEISIKNVEAKVVYFSPSDLYDQINWDWKKSLEKTFNIEKDFFRFHLGNTINFSVYPDIIRGRNEHQFYDGENTKNGNPNALISAREEVIKRIFSDSGDLYLSSFVKNRPNTYEILIIIYEGTGASAMIYQKNAVEGPDVFKIETDGPPAIILSSAFLHSPYYLEFGPTILAHEISHSFGLSDSYDVETGKIFGSDLMGEGRRRTPNATYLSTENKKLLGSE